MSKIISIKVESCSECPYCQYDGYYDRSKDSGYDCKHPDLKGSERIVDDWEFRNSNNPNPKGWPEIMETCPLQNI